MLNLFVLDVLKAFLPEEKEEFRLYLSTPFFNKGANREPLIQLLGLLLTAQENGTIDELEKETIFQLIFPGKVLVESKVDKLISELKRQVQNFLTVRRYLSPKNEPRRALDFAFELRQKGLESRYQQTLEKIRKEADTYEQETMEHYFFRHLIALEEHEWQSIYNKAKGDVHIPEVIGHLDNYYRTLKTEMLNRLLLQQKLAPLSPKASEMLEAPWTMPAYVLENNALAKVSWEIHELLKATKPETRHFSRLLAIIQQNELKFSAENLAEFYTYLRNICSFLIDAGETDFYVVLHDIHRDNLQRGYFYFDGKITPNACLSITHTAISVDAIDWAKSFVQAHKDRIIDENSTRDFYQLNNALCLFAEKKYESALEIIPFGSSYSSYHLMARRLEMKIYYEMGSDLLPYKIDAFKMYISRAGSKLLSERQQELYVNFSNLVRQLSLSPTNRDKARAAIMMQRIHEKKLVAERNWLLEKARELGGSKK